jgi:hypothetical protein
MGFGFYFKFAPTATTARFILLSPHFFKFSHNVRCMLTCEASGSALRCAASDAKLPPFWNVIWA